MTCRCLLTYTKDWHDIHNISISLLWNILSYCYWLCIWALKRQMKWWLLPNMSSFFQVCPSMSLRISHFVPLLQLFKVVPLVVRQEHEPKISRSSPCALPDRSVLLWNWNTTALKTTSVTGHCTSHRCKWTKLLLAVT